MKTLEEKIKFCAAEACGRGISQGSMLRLIRKKLLLKAKLAYNKGEFASMYEARKTVPSIKQLKLYMEGTNATECEHNKVLSADSREVLDYLA